MISIIIPTYNRVAVLVRTLDALISQRSAGSEIILIDDGSEDGSFEHASVLAARSEGALTVLGQTNRGPAAARNLGMTVARGDVYLFLGDDTVPAEGLVRRHHDFHLRHPRESAALLGRIAWPEDASTTEFMHWLDDSGTQFAYSSLEAGQRVTGRHFYSSNASVKRALVLRAGRFDASFRHAAGEDIDLGLRLDECGMQLIYDPNALVVHNHPTDLAAAIERMSRVAEARRLLVERHPDAGIEPGPPRLRHRLKSALLYLASLAPPARERLRPEMWRFLCHEALREAFHDSPRTKHGRPVIGSRLHQRLTEKAR